ncbi:MAG: RNA-processing protein [Euryarchaeota archaeon RBG_13_31_8]|nr:MAG: RNA-processing protein [Euryarchaeota archaeon RBG_13_31_8]
MKYVRIPLDRIGVLIGQKGETKKDIEAISGIKLKIDSVQGEVEIDDHEAKDPLVSLKIENVIKAIGRGFSPQNAIKLVDDFADFFIFDLHDYVGKKESHLRRLKSRIIGKEGKTKRVLEELTGAKISIYGHTVAIISDLERMNILKKSIDMLLTGSKHATVYRFVEAQMKELRRTEKLGR